MRVIVLGGVIGVTTAYELRRAGHEVVVLERQASVCMETSFANAGQVSPSYSSPWAAPGIPSKAFRWLAMRHRPLVLWPRLDPSLFLWLSQLLANCTEDAYRRNKGRMLRLAEFSRHALRDTRTALALDYVQQTLGTMQLFRNERKIDGMRKDCLNHDSFGTPYEVLDQPGCRAHEPALGLAKGYVGALRLPNDKTGDAHLFTKGFHGACVGRGIEFHIGASIRALVADGRRIDHVALYNGGRIDGDAFVAAVSGYAAALLKPLGVNLPASPLSTVMDETYKVAITRLGSRIGLAEQPNLQASSIACAHCVARRS